jgi:hypothetical protein
MAAPQMQQAASDDHIQLKRRFADFLETTFPTPEDPQWTYANGLAALYTSDDGAEAGKAAAPQLDAATLVSRRLMVAEHHLRAFDEGLLNRVLSTPSACLPAFEEALRDLVRSGRDPTLAKLVSDQDTVVHVGLKGDFGRHELSPRDLDASCLNKLVCVFGIVTKCSLVRPKVSGHHDRMSAGVTSACAGMFSSSALLRSNHPAAHGDVCMAVNLGTNLSLEMLVWLCYHEALLTEQPRLDFDAKKPC